MPVVDRDIERQIVIQGREQGKSDDEIKKFVTIFREQTLKKQATDKERTKGVVGQIAGGTAGLVGEQAAAVRGAVSKEGLSRGLARAEAFTRGGPIPTLFRAGEVVREKAADVAGAAVETAAALPTAVRGAVRAGEELGTRLEEGQGLREALAGPGVLSPEEQAKLESAGERAIGVTADVAGVIPQPGAQFAAGLVKGQRKAIEEDKQPLEALLRGVTSGAERVALLKAIEGITGKKLRPKKARAVKKETKAVAEKIQPQKTASEKRLALKEDRLIEARESKLFGKKEAKIKPSKRNAEAAATIEDEIPNAARKSTTKLKSAIDEKITTKSQALKPELKKAKVSKQTKKDLGSDYAKLKKDQIDDLEFEANNGSKLQKLFEERYLKKARKAKNHDDMWELRKALDKDKQIAPRNVKNATDLSDASLQYRQEKWLELREVLNKAVKSGEAGLGTKVAGEFRKLRDLIRGRDNIIQKAPEVAKRKKGIITPKRVVGTGITGAAGFLGLRASQ